jgi:hypothetical protein
VTSTPQAEDPITQTTVEPTPEPTPTPEYGVTPQIIGGTRTREGPEPTPDLVPEPTIQEPQVIEETVAPLPVSPMEKVLTTQVESDQGIFVTKEQLSPEQQTIVESPEIQQFLEKQSESVEFFTEAGFSQFGGLYEAPDVPEGYKVTDVVATTEGLELSVVPKSTRELEQELVASGELAPAPSRAYSESEFGFKVATPKLELYISETQKEMEQTGKIWYMGIGAVALPMIAPAVLPASFGVTTKGVVLGMGISVGVSEGISLVTTGEHITLEEGVESAFYGGLLTVGTTSLFNKFINPKILSPLAGKVKGWASSRLTKSYLSHQKSVVGSLYKYGEPVGGVWKPSLSQKVLMKVTGAKPSPLAKGIVSLGGPADEIILGSRQVKGGLGYAQLEAMSGSVDITVAPRSSGFMISKAPASAVSKVASPLTRGVYFNVGAKLFTYQELKATELQQTRLDAEFNRSLQKQLDTTVKRTSGSVSRTTGYGASQLAQVITVQKTGSMLGGVPSHLFSLAQSPVYKTLSFPSIWVPPETLLPSGKQKIKQDQLLLPPILPKSKTKTDQEPITEIPRHLTILPPVILPKTKKPTPTPLLLPKQKLTPRTTIAPKLGLSDVTKEIQKTITGPVPVQVPKQITKTTTVTISPLLAPEVTLPILPAKGVFGVGQPRLFKTKQPKLIGGIWTKRKHPVKTYSAMLKTFGLSPKKLKPKTTKKKTKKKKRKKNNFDFPF